MKRVLVTGAAGVIGRALLRNLAGRYELCPLTHRPASFPSFVADISDLSAIAPAFENVDAVVHLAAAAAVDAPWDAVLEGNIIGTRNVFEASRMANVPLVVFASSNHVIGSWERQATAGLYALEDMRVFDENTEIRPDSLYGVSKAFGEALGRFYSDAFGMRVICLRIGSVLDDDDPRSPAVASSAPWLDLRTEERFARMRATWLSQRDCAELVACALDAQDVRWVIAYGISDNPRQFWNLRTAREVLGYCPQDRSPL